MSKRTNITCRRKEKKKSTCRKVLSMPWPLSPLTSIAFKHETPLEWIVPTLPHSSVSKPRIQQSSPSLADDSRLRILRQSVPTQWFDSEWTRSYFRWAGCTWIWVSNGLWCRILTGLLSDGDARIDVGPREILQVFGRRLERGWRRVCYGYVLSRRLKRLSWLEFGEKGWRKGPLRRRWWKRIEGWREVNWSGEGWWYR